jgi:exodeoxyribonuclease V gamma subunit
VVDVLHLVHGNRFEELADALAGDLAAAGRDLFAPATIAVPGPLVAGSLRLAIARRLGIAANLAFPFLEELFSQLVTRARPDWLVLDRRRLQSLLIGMLGEELAGEELAPVRRYVTGDQAVRTVQLAGELATVFVDYGLTRPEMVAGWSRQADGWQSILWRALFAPDGPAGRAALAAGKSRAGLLSSLFAELPAGELSAAGPIHLFGFSYLAPGYRPMLARLARGAEVRIYTPNPCREFWDDASDPDDAPALAAWGRPGREHIAALNEMAEGRFSERFVDPCLGAEPTALRRFQRDVLDRAPRRTAADRAAASGDDSVRVLACPGVRRELEVIAGEIGRMLAADPTLRLCDIAVLLAPDGCERYQAQIGAVFDEMGGIGHRQLELPLGGELLAVGMLLDLPLGRFTRPELLGLMVHPAVLARSPDVDRDDWIRWCDQLGIVHGADRDDHRGTYIERDLYNWDQGIRRLALGSFMDVDADPVRLGGQSYLPARIAPDERRSAARFALLARTLLAAARDCRDRPRPLAEWARDLDRLVAAHIAPEDGDDRVLTRCRQCIRDLAELDLDRRPVDYAVARELLRQSLGRLRSPGGELPTDAVLVAPLAALRPLPFRILFVAGLGAGRFPAGDRAGALDLRAGARRVGDVSPRDRDRYAFLETVLAARDRLVLSYVARDEETGEELEPSPLVHELCEMLVEGYLAPRDAEELIARPPLRRWIAGADPVSRRQAACAELRRDLVANLPRVPSEVELAAELHRPERRELARALGVVTVEVEASAVGSRLTRATPAEPLVLPLAALRRFLECPMQAWAGAVLRLRPGEEEDLIARRDEPFERGMLALTASLRGVFLAHLNDGGSAEALARLHREACARAELDGRAPTGPFAAGAALRGARVLDSWRRALESAAGALPPTEVIGFGAVREGEVVRLEPAIEIEAAGRPVLLTGRTEPVAEEVGSIVLVTGDQVSARHWLRGAMDAVALAASGAAEPHAMTILTGAGAAETVRFAAIEPAAARGYLAELVEELFGRAHDYLLPCEAALPHGRGEASGPLDQAVGKLVDRDQFFSTLAGPLRLPRGIAPPPDGSEMAARRFRIWRDR